MGKIKFKNSNGDLICAGDFDGLTAGPGETVENFSGATPDDIEIYRRTAPGVISLKPQPEIDGINDARKIFTPFQFMNKFNNKFPAATDVEKFLAKSIAQLAGGIRQKAVD